MIQARWLPPQIAKFIGPTWGPPGSCRPQVGPMLAPWILLSGSHSKFHDSPMIADHPTATTPKLHMDQHVMFTPLICKLSSTEFSKWGVPPNGERFDITVTSHEHHNVLHHRETRWSFQQFTEANIKENIKALYYWPLGSGEGKPPSAQWIPSSTRASNVEPVPMSWTHNEMEGTYKCALSNHFKKVK